jgi:hypothetical protein
MTTKDLLINDGCDWKTIETVGKSLPQFDVVSSLACCFSKIRMSWLKKNKNRSINIIFNVMPVEKEGN